MIKTLLKRGIRSFGFDLRRYNPATSEGARFIGALSAHKVNLIFDVGANTGQFGRSLRDLGYKGRIVSFEPLDAAWNKLGEASQKDSLWEVAVRAAIGDEDGEVEINVSGNSVSSSVLRMQNAHVSAAPESVYIGTEKVPIRRLDTVGAGYLRADSTLFLKIDTQGYEAQVLRGASDLLQKVVGLHLELSFVPLYEEQCIYDALISQLKALGFEMWDIVPNFIDARSGRLLQADATFFRG